MSLEAALDEERREVMNALQGRRSSVDQSSRLDQTSTPPIRSMLDISSPLPRHAPGGSAGSMHPAQQIRSMLDTKRPPPVSAPSPPISRSALNSPVSEKAPQARNRSTSEASNIPVEGLRKISEKHGVDINQDYQFEVLPTAPNHALPKRVSQGGRQLLSSGAMAAAMSGELSRGREHGRRNSTAVGPTKSKSPSTRLSARSQSPSVFHNVPYSPTVAPSTFVTDSGKVIDMDKAYRRLSDVAFRKLGSSLAPKRKGSKKLPQNDGEGSPSPEPGSRIHVDSEGEDHAVAESSGDEADSTDDEGEGSRGRRRSRRPKSFGNTEGEWADDESEKNGLETTIGMGRAKGPRQVQSLLAAAEEERVAVSSVTGEPTITVSNPAGERVTPKKSGVHPITSFDHTASGYNTEASSENEADLSDIRRAQKLSINMSHIDSTVPNRTMRTILRGDFARMEEEAEEGLRRQRMYLVATDLSDEAVYALEWTIGTILRDGDTLFAIYAMDDEPVGTGKAHDTDLSHKDHHGEGAKAAKEAFDAMASLTKQAKTNPVPQPSPLVLQGYLPATDAGSRPTSVDSRSMTKTDAERHRAIDEISQTCVRLLRKTKLQVRVALEVIHCKSPKHLITEAVRYSSALTIALLTISRLIHCRRRLSYLDHVVDQL